MSDVIGFVSREIISGTSNMVKELARVGFKPAYKQDFFEEFKYRVASLTADLRDGIVLAYVSRDFRFVSNSQYGLGCHSTWTKRHDVDDLNGLYRHSLSGLPKMGPLLRGLEQTLLSLTGRDGNWLRLLRNGLPDPLRANEPDARSWTEWPVASI